MRDPEAPEPAAASPQDDAGYAALERIVDERYVTVRAGGQDLVVTAHSVELDLDAEEGPGARDIMATLPRVRAVLADFAAVRERATEYLWAFGATGDESDEEKANFLREMVPSTLVIAGPAAIELHYDDISEKYMPQGYWPAVHLDADLTPVEVSVEA
jgi:hypothetical protein